MIHKLEKFIYFLTCFTVMIPSYGFANPPLKVDQIESLGRLTYFKNQAEFSYYLPSAFHNDMECNPQGNQKYRCILRIYNELNAQELDQLRNAGPSNALSDLSYKIVNGINESLDLKSEIIEKSSEKSIFTKTLRLSEAPYVLSSFLLEKRKLESFMDAYRNTSLGQFKVKVDLNSSETSFYLSIKNARTLKNKLLSLERKRIKANSLNTIIENMVTELDVEAKGFRDPRPLLQEIIKVKYFQAVSTFGESRYQLRQNLAHQIKSETETLLDDTTENNPFTCEVTLEIHENAQPTTQCQRKDETENEDI